MGVQGENSEKESRCELLNKRFIWKYKSEEIILTGKLEIE